MLKRLIVAVVGFVGVVVIALGVASATLWRADDVLVADLRADEQLVVTDPGVLELAGTEVTVRAEADGPVVLAIGRDTDVTGWVGDDPHQRVTGLSGWHELAADDVAAPTPTPSAESPAPEGEAAAEGEAPEGEAAPEGETAPEGEAAPEGETAPEGEGEATEVVVPDPTGSDMWVAEAAGDGEAEITWTAQPGRWSLLAASTDGQPVRLSLAWPQVVTTPWLWPCVLVGSFLVLVAGALLLRDVRRGRRDAERDWTPVLTGPLPTVDASGATVQLTRRQMRELAAQHAARATAPRGEPAPEGPGEPTGRPDRETDAPAREEPRVPEPVGSQVSHRAAAHSTAVASGSAASTARGAASRAAAPPTAPVPSASSADVGAAARETPTEPAVPASRRALRALTSAVSTRGGREAASDRTDTATASSGSTAAAGRPGADDASAERPGASRATPGTAGAVRASAGWVPAATTRPGEPEVPAAPTSRRAWNPAPGRSVDAAPAATRPDATPPARGQDEQPHGRPAWLGRGPVSATEDRRGPDSASRTGAHAAPSDAPAAGRPGWAAPRPGAVVGPGAGPDARRRPVDAPPASPGASGGPAEGAPRPAWLRDAPVPDGPRAGAAQPAPQPGSRADAWRRAWGMSPDDDPTSEEGR